jgi:RHS repeat-associated protein
VVTYFVCVADVPLTFQCPTGWLSPTTNTLTVEGLAPGVHYWQVRTSIAEGRFDLDGAVAWAFTVPNGTASGRRLTVQLAGTGSGRVAFPGFDCRAGSCLATYTEGTVVSLWALPNAGSLLVGWSGACSGPNYAMTVTMTTDVSCTATFDLLPNLTPTKLLPANGTTLPGTTATLQWEAIPNVVAYFLCVADTPLTFGCPTGWLAPASNTFTVEGLSPGVHYWQVRTSIPQGRFDLDDAVSWGFVVPGVVPSQTEHYHVDALGSVRVVTDASGQVPRYHDFEPFGAEWNATLGPRPESHLFTGKERDPGTGLDYFGARYLASELGRFTTTDPVYTWTENLVDPQRWNRYAYVRNNPLRYVDPDGGDIRDFVAGVGNALLSNLRFGAGRTSGNRDYTSGQRLGDVLSLVGSAVETTTGSGFALGGLVACGTGVLCVAGAPAIAGGATIAGHGVGMGVAAGISLMKSLTQGVDGERQIPDGPAGEPHKPTESWLKSQGVDPHTLKEHFGSKVDLYVDREGNLWTLPKRGGKAFEWEGNLNQFKEPK